MNVKKIRLACIIACTGIIITGCSLPMNTAEVNEAVKGVLQKIQDIDVGEVVIVQEDASESYETSATVAFKQYIGDEYSTRCAVYDTADGLSAMVTPQQDITYSRTTAGRYISTNPYLNRAGETALNIGTHFYIEYENKWYLCTGMLFQKESNECTQPEAVQTMEELLYKVCTPENYRKNVIEKNLDVDVKSIDTYVYNDELYIYIYDSYEQLKKVVNLDSRVIYAFDVWYAPEAVAKLQESYLPGGKPLEVVD